MAIEIVDWDEHYENNRTRVLKYMTWVPMPVGHDGDGYTLLLDHPNGAAHFGAWCALVQVAAKCRPRGTLVRHSGGDHDSGSLSRITRIPEAIWDEVLPRLATIGWIKGYKIRQVSARIRHESAGRTSTNGTERNGMNGTEIEPGRGRVTEVPPSEDLALYHAAEESFLSRNDGRFTDYGKEGAALKGLVKKAKARAPDTASTFLLQMITAFWKLRCNGDKFWRGQPFVPSALNSSGIWDRVLETLRREEVDPDVLAIIKGAAK